MVTKECMALSKVWITLALYNVPCKLTHIYGGKDNTIGISHFIGLEIMEWKGQYCGFKIWRE